MKVGDVIRNAKGKKRVIVGRTPAGEWVVKPVNGQVLDILSAETVRERWTVVDDGRTGS